MLPRDEEWELGDVSASVPPWAPSCCCPAPETQGSAPGRAVPSSQARELGAVICLSLHGGGWMPFVKDPPRSPVRAGAAAAAGTPGTPVLRTLAVPKTAAPGCPHLQTGAGDTPASTSSPWHHCHRPGAGGGWTGSPHEIWGVLSPVPCHPGLWVWGGGFGPHGTPALPRLHGGTAPVSQSGAGHGAGVTATPA